MPAPHLRLRCVSPPSVLNAALLSLLCALFGAPTSTAQTQPDFAVHPSHERGLSANTAYEVGLVDDINLFNGNLVVTLPLGQRYPVGGGFSWGLSLTYNSNLWDWTEEDTLCDPPQGPYPQVIAAATPNRHHNAGLGWLLTPGRLESGDGMQPFPSSPAYTFIGPDGASHPFIEDSPTDPVLWGLHGFHARLERLSCGLGAMVCYQLETPSGVRYDFDRYGRVVAFEDPSGNRVTVSPPPPNPGSGTWTYEDDHGRKAIIQLTLGSDGEPRIQSVKVQRFGDAPGAPTATYVFSYQTFTLPRHSQSNYDCENPETHDVDLLKEIRLEWPGGGPEVLYELDYLDRNEEPQDVGSDQDGLLEAIHLPSGGRYEWQFGQVGPTDSGPDANHPETPPPFLIRTQGVIERTVRDLVGTDPAGRADLGTTTYRYFLNELDLDVIPGGRSQEKYTKVVEPTGRTRYHYFNVLEDGGTVALGLPFSPRHPDPAAPESGRYLSTLIMDSDRAVAGDGGDPTTSNMHTPPDEPLVATYVKYHQDSCSFYPGCLVYSPYVEQERSTYPEKMRTTSQGPCGAPVYDPSVGHESVTVRSSYKGWGRYAVTAIDGDLTPEDEETRKAEFLSTYAHPPNHPWELGITKWSSVEGAAPGTDPANTVETYHDPGTGQLLRQRILTSEAQVDPDSPNLARLDKDLLAVYTYDGDGNRVREDFYGGDVQTVGTASLGSVSLPGTPQYSIVHDYTHGVRSRSVRVDPSDNDREVLLLEELSIDRATGLVASATNAAGITTTYDYDERGRVTLIDPEDDAEYVFTYTPPGSGAVSPQSPAKAEVQRKQGAATLLHTILTFDGQGRVVREDSLLPGGWSARRTEFNAQGQKRRETGLQTPGSTPKWTSYTYDSLGRLCQETRPDLSQTQIYHQGIEAKKEATQVRTPNGLTSQARNFEYDVHGRLRSVRENSGPNGAGIRTYYTYDAGGRLEGVESGSESGAASPIQHRTFDYDGRGFLKRECHPEKGYLNSGDTGCVQYGAFDAQGNPASRTDGPFTLAYAYDAIGRLTQVSEANAGLLKEFFYAPSNEGSDLRAGKLVQAKRHNYVDGTDYVVTETYGYEGPEGRVSSRRTTVRDLSGESAGSQWFEQSFTYDELGNLESQSYPACRHALCSTTRPDRTVSYTYNRGFLTAVPGYAPSLTYHRNGALATVVHENGALDAVTIAGHKMPRPQSMTSTPVSGDPWVSGAFVYDAAGNIQSIGPDQYYYDEVSRLVQAEVYLDGQQATEHYTYDRFGNLTSMATQGLGSATFDTVAWNVDPLTNRLIPAAGEFAYDAAGNLTTSGAGTGAFDAFNMMTSLSGPGRNERYLYTPQDERIATINHLAARPTFEWTLRGLDQKVLTTYESELATFEPDPGNPGNPIQEHQGWSWQKDYIYRGSSLLAAAVTDNVGGDNREHFHLDHLGTPRLKTDQYGTELASHKYLPYGEELTNPELDNEVMQFTAHERDRDPSGFGNDLDYMHARYYSPRLGRFMSVDPVGGRPELPQSWNRYSYVSGNPILKLDPDGRDELVFIWSPRDDQVGHAAFGIQLRDDYGKPDGRLEVRHLWPAEPVGKSLQAGADYRTEIIAEADLRNFEGGEGRAADGILRITGDAAQDARALQVLERMEGDPTYRVPDNTCSTYCAAAVETTGIAVDQFGTGSVFKFGAKIAEQDGLITPVSVYNSIVDSGDPRVIIEVPLESRDPNIEIR